MSMRPSNTNGSKTLLPRTQASTRSQDQDNELVLRRASPAWTIYTPETASAQAPWKRRGRPSRTDRLKAKLALANTPQSTPTSHNDRVGNELVRCIDDFNMSVLPLVFSPALLGRSSFLDAAVDVLIQLHRHSAPQYSSLEQKAPLLRGYNKALVLARTAIATPEARRQRETLLALDILGVAVSLIHLHDSEWNGAFNHWSCEAAILLEDVTTRQDTPNVHTTLCPLEKLAFVMPAYAGQPSPYEGTSWQQLERPSTNEDLKHIMRIRAVTTELFVKLPRIICAIRLLRTDPRESANLSSALRLLENVIVLKDDDAESWLLHRVQLVETRDHFLKRIAPLSFTYRSLEEMDIAVDYWKARMLVRRLYTTAISFAPPEHPAQTPAADLIQQELRFGKNILMSIEYSLDHVPCGTRCMPAAILATWVTMRPLPSYRSVPIAEVGLYLKDVLQECWLGWMFPSSMPAFNVTAGVMEGGPLDPIFTKILKGVQPEA